LGKSLEYKRNWIKHVNRMPRNRLPRVMKHWNIIFWVFPRRLNIKSRRFGTLCRFHLHRWLGVKMGPTECPETSAFNIQTPGKYSEENIPYS
jgi:hypothetical protein